MPSPNRTCKYSKCNTEYFACGDSIRLNGVKAHCCSSEHYSKWQTEVAFFRKEDISNNQYIKEMVIEGALPDTVLKKPNAVRKKYTEPEIEPICEV